ncbi:hypothetical protein FQN51_006180 [Onygenales sp. PD_10]|nr:hypothetical protein FQN51_006180 [Onygenales sp. PD_10]
MPLFSHYGDVPDISYQLSYPSLVLSIVTPLFVAARFVGRLYFSGRIGPDDWAILAALVFAEVVSIQMIIVCGLAFGKHTDDVPPLVVARTLKARDERRTIYFVAQILYKVSIGLTKISILLLYRRIFMRQWFLATCSILTGIIIAFTTATVFASIFQCTPIEYAFKKKLPGGGTCISLAAFWYANATFNILSDLVLIALPAPVISTLQLPRKSKIALCGIFAVGIFVCITSVLRITTLDIATSYFDIPWNSIGSSMWTVIESNLGIICACLPALARPISRISPTIFGKYHLSDHARGASDNGSKQTTNHIINESTNRTASWKRVRDETLGSGEWQMDDYSHSSQERIVRTREFIVQHGMRSEARDRRSG